MGKGLLCSLCGSRGVSRTPRIAWRPTVASQPRDEGAGLLRALAAAAKQEQTQHASYVNRTACGYQNDVHNVRRPAARRQGVSRDISGNEHAQAGDAAFERLELIDID